MTSKSMVISTLKVFQCRAPGVVVTGVHGQGWTKKGRLQSGVLAGRVGKGRGMPPTSRASEGGGCMQCGIACIFQPTIHHANITPSISRPSFAKRCVSIASSSGPTTRGCPVLSCPASHVLLQAASAPRVLAGRPQPTGETAITPLAPSLAPALRRTTTHCPSRERHMLAEATTLLFNWTSRSGMVVMQELP